jgi:hypothetical protein
MSLKFVPRLKFVYLLAASRFYASVSFTALVGRVRRKYELLVPERVTLQIPVKFLTTSKRRPATMQLKIIRPRLSGVGKMRTWINVIRQAPKRTPIVVALPEPGKRK